MYLTFIRMPGQSCSRRLESLLLYLCSVFGALINSLVCRFILREIRVRHIMTQEQRYPFLSVQVVISCVPTMVRLPVFGVFNVLTDVDAYDCTRGLYEHSNRVCAGN